MPEIVFPTWDPAKKALAKTAFDGVKTILKDYLVNLTPEERKRVFKQGVGREPFVNDVSTTAHQYPTAIPDDCDLDTLDNVNAIRKDFGEIITYASSLIEGLNDALMLAGVQGLDICNDIYKYLKITAQSNTPLSDKVKDLGKVYKKTSNRIPDTILGVPAGATIQLKGLVRLSRIVNVGETVLICKCAIELGGSVKAFDDINIEPGGSFRLPKGITSVYIVNSDATKAGSISIKLK